MLTVCWRSHKRHETTAWSSRQWLRRSRFTLWKADISCRSCVWTCLCLMTLTPALTTGSCTSCLGPTLAGRASTSSRYSVLINKHQLWIIYVTSQYTSTVVWMIIDAQLHVFLAFTIRMWSDALVLLVPIIFYELLNYKISQSSLKFMQCHCWLFVTNKTLSKFYYKLMLKTYNI